MSKICTYFLYCFFSVEKLLSPRGGAICGTHITPEPWVSPVTVKVPCGVDVTVKGLRVSSCLPREPPGVPQLLSSALWLNRRVEVFSWFTDKFKLRDRTCLVLSPTLHIYYERVTDICLCRNLLCDAIWFGTKSYSYFTVNALTFHGDQDPFLWLSGALTLKQGW